MSFVEACVRQFCGCMGGRGGERGGAMEGGREGERGGTRERGGKGEREEERDGGREGEREGGREMSDHGRLVEKQVDVSMHLVGTVTRLAHGKAVSTDRLASASA